MDYKELFGEEFYNKLVKCNFINDIDELLTADTRSNLVNIDVEDIKSLSKGEIVGTISQIFNNSSEELIINRFSDKEATKCIFNITSGSDLDLSTVTELIYKLRNVYPNINMIYGTKIDDKYNDKLKVQALLTTKLVVLWKFIQLYF